MTMYPVTMAVGEMKISFRIPASSQEIAYNKAKKSGKEFVKDLLTGLSLGLDVSPLYRKYGFYTMEGAQYGPFELKVTKKEKK